MLSATWVCTNCGGAIQTDRMIHVTEVNGTNWCGTVMLRCGECGRRYEKPISMMVLDDETETV